MSFGKKLKALRLENDMTQKYVAARLNVARSTIAGYETKDRQPSHEKLSALASLFHVSIDYLLDGTTVELMQNQHVPDPETASDQYVISKYHSLTRESKKDLLNYIQLLELRDKNGK